MQPHQNLPVPNLNRNQIQSVLASTNHTFYVYMDLELVWAFYHELPVTCIQTLDDGSIGYLNDEGHLGILYLGMNQVDWGKIEPKKE